MYAITRITSLPLLALPLVVTEIVLTTTITLQTLTVVTTTVTTDRHSCCLPRCRNIRRCVYYLAKIIAPLRFDAVGEAWGAETLGEVSSASPPITPAETQPNASHI